MTWTTGFCMPMLEAMADDENTLRVLARCDDHLHVERREDGEVRRGIARPQPDGEPIPAGVEYIADVEPCGEPGTYRVTESYRIPGPARVSSPAYRDGYDRIFGKGGRKGPTDKSQLN